MLEENRKRAEKEAKDKQVRDETEAANKLRRDASTRLLNIAADSGNPLAWQEAFADAQVNKVLPDGIVDSQSFIKSRVVDKEEGWDELAGASGVLWRMNPETGAVETKDLRDDLKLHDETATDTIHKTYPKAGFSVYKSGKVEWLAPEFKEALAEASTDGKKVKNWHEESGTVLMDDGTTLQITPILSKDKDKVIDPFRINAVYSKGIEKIRTGSVDNVKLDAETELENLGMSELQAKEQALKWADDFERHRMDIEWNQEEKAILGTAIELQAAVDQALGELKDKDLRKAVGLYAGLKGRLLRTITGGSSDDPVVTRFLALLLNVRDKLFARSRSGGAVTQEEQELYSEILGSDISDIDALVDKMEVVIEFENRARRSIYNAAFERKGEPMTEETRALIPQYEALHVRPKTEDTRANSMSAEDVMYGQ